jgi:hypothetical protein
MIKMYTAPGLDKKRNSYPLLLDGVKVADFYCQGTADLTANLLNVVRAQRVTSRMQAG